MKRHYWVEVLPETKTDSGIITVYCDDLAFWTNALFNIEKIDMGKHFNPDNFNPDIRCRRQMRSCYTWAEVGFIIKEFEKDAAKV